MKFIVMSIRDRAAEVYSQPMFLVSVGAGVRTFNMEVNRQDEKNMLWLHPEDFDLYDLGTFDDNAGVFDLHRVPRQVAVGKDTAVRESKLRAVN